MSEATDALKDKFNEAKNIAADPSRTPAEAVKEVFGIAHNEMKTAANYTANRAARKKAVADRLQQIRKERGMKQQEVAEKTGIHVITLSGYELGRNEPNMEALVRLADVYQVTLDYLMCRTD